MKTINHPRSSATTYWQYFVEVMEHKLANKNEGQDLFNSSVTLPGKTVFIKTQEET